MATVKMVKGSKYADIFDSPEMIAGAQADGYVLVESKKTETVLTDNEVKTETVRTTSARTSKRSN